jgi:hypothetical protein
MSGKSLSILAFLLILPAASWSAGPREKAWKLHNRLTGIPPRPEVLSQMEAFIAQGQPEKATELAMQNPAFYNVTLNNWLKPWSNAETSPRVDLNDFVATALGIIRDDEPFDKLLYDDVLYTLDVEGLTYSRGTPMPVFSYSSNAHYYRSEDNFVNIAERLVRNRQSDITPLPSGATAGILTSKAFGDAFYSGGTNRRQNRFVFVNFLCTDYEDMHDNTIPDFRVRRDIERNPGGDSRNYKNNCVGCHAGQDALAGAYAHYNHVQSQVSGEIIYDPTNIARKMTHNVYFRDGFNTVDDSWINLWTSGQNAALGWRGAMEGRGVKSLGRMFTRSRAFAQCMSKRVFELVCMREPQADADKQFVSVMADEFEAIKESNHQRRYNMKNLISKTSIGCIVNED